MITPTSIMHVTPETRTMTAQITPVQTRPERGEGSKALTWLSEKRRRTARSLQSSCPYPKTPVGTRPLHSTLYRQHSAKTVHQANNRDCEFSWQGLVNKTWHVYKLSPMHLFSFEPDSLRMYSKHLSAHFEAVMNNTAVDVGENNDRIETVKIRATDNKDIIELQLCQKQKQDGNSDRVLLSAIFFCPKTDTDLPNAFTLLPLLLIKGSLKLIGNLIAWWQAQFDTCITKFVISPLQLMWLVAMLAGSTTGQRSKPVEFLFKMPEEVRGLSTLTFSVNADDCQRIWQSIHGTSNQDDLCTSEQVVSFVSAMDEHFYHHFGVRLQALHLYSVGTAVVHVSNDGRLKIYSADHAIRVLTYLAEEAMKQDLL